MEKENFHSTLIRVSRLRPYMYIGIVCIFLVVLLSYTLFFSPPSNFPVGSIVTVSSGETLHSVVIELQQQGAIRSSVVFQSLVILFGGEKKVIAGDYLLEKKDNAAHLALRLVRGDFGMVEVKVTIPEGFSVSDIGDVLERKLVRFDKLHFLQTATNQEGYLFPDTYFFPPTATSSAVVARMEENFYKKMLPFAQIIATSTHSQYDILKMASILEGEAKNTTDRKIVAGILWNRIKKGIALQVDATFKYINGKTTAELTLDDLKINSPYNTYVYRGLPPTPINNPGVDAITAALYPTPTPYLYFLTGTDGVMHYAKTFEEHLKNKERYLR